MVRAKEHAQAAIFPIGYGILSTSTNQENAGSYQVADVERRSQPGVRYGGRCHSSHIANLQAWRDYWESVFLFEINTQVAIDQAVSHA